MTKIRTKLSRVFGIPAHFRRNRDGAVAVEIALTSLVTFTIFIGLIEFGLMIRSRMEVSSGARAGAQYAISDPDDTAGITDAVKGASNLKDERLSVSVSRSCECPDGTAIDCADDTTCPTDMWRFVSVEANYDHALVLAYPGIPNPVRVVRIAKFRVE